MPSEILSFIESRTPLQLARDALDILLVAFLIYRALLIVRGTRAIQMAAGLAILFLVYLGAKALGLATLTSILSSLVTSVLVLVIVIFQNDIRRALIRMGGTALLTSARERESRVIDEVVAAATELARHRMGAIIAFEQDANVLEFVKSEGIVLDSMVTRELLVSLFVPESANKLHDGAVLIRDLKIARAGVFFPMPDTKIADHSLGSRHRASLGITEETDAVVVVVSEERGTISFCFSGNIAQNLDADSLRSALEGSFGRRSRKAKAQKQAAKPPLAAVVASRQTTLSGAGKPPSRDDSAPRSELRSSVSIHIEDEDSLSDVPLPAIRDEKDGARADRSPLPAPDPARASMPHIDAEADDLPETGRSAAGEAASLAPPPEPRVPSMYPPSATSTPLPGSRLPQLASLKSIDLADADELPDVPILRSEGKLMPPARLSKIVPTLSDEDSDASGSVLASAERLRNMDEEEDEDRHPSGPPSRPDPGESRMGDA